MFKQPDLATILNLLAGQGRDAFYHGEIADKLEAYMIRKGGLLEYGTLPNAVPTGLNRFQRCIGGMKFWRFPPTAKGLSY